MKRKDTDPCSQNPAKGPKAKRAHSIGEYVADYSPVATEAIQRPIPEVEKLFSDSMETVLKDQLERPTLTPRRQR